MRRVYAHDREKLENPSIIVERKCIATLFVFFYKSHHCYARSRSSHTTQVLFLSSRFQSFLLPFTEIFQPH